MRAVHVVERLRRRIFENRCLLMQYTRADVVGRQNRSPGRRDRLRHARKRNESSVRKQDRRHLRAARSSRATCKLTDRSLAFQALSIIEFDNHFGNHV